MLPIEITLYVGIVDGLAAAAPSTAPSTPSTRSASYCSAMKLSIICTFCHIFFLKLYAECEGVKMSVAGPEYTENCFDDPSPKECRNAQKQHALF